MRVDRLGYQPIGRDITVVPQARGGIWKTVRRWVDRAEFGADDSPSPLGFGAAQRGQHARPEPAIPGTMGNLVKAILRSDRPDLDRFEQNIVTRIASHAFSLPALCFQTPPALSKMT
jgi:hypothetical protein